jgi:hypothetical protein
LAKSEKNARAFFMNSEQPASGAPLPSHRRLAALNLEEPVVIDFGARAQDFLKRITPLSADLAGHGRTRTLALQKLHRICQAEVRTLKARYTLATVKLALSKYPERESAPWTPITWSCAQEKCTPASASAISRSNPKKPARWNAAYHERIHRDQSNLIPLDPEAFIHTALELLASDRYLQKGMGLDGPHRAQACRDLLQCLLQPP